MVRIAKVGMFALGALLILSVYASAQTLPTGLAGAVRDSSGAVMPGGHSRGRQRRAHRESQNGRV
jgi:hypothetical protein